MRFRDVTPIERADAEAAFKTGESTRINSALVSLAYHDQDWLWVQGVCLGLLDHDDPEVRGLAATCLGHLARVHGKLDRDRVVPALRALSADAQVGGRAEDALEDIDQYLQ